MSLNDPGAPDPKSKNPALAAGGVTAIAGGILWVAIEFGADLTAGQQAAILGLAVLILPLLQAAWTRAKVWSPASVAKLLRGEDLKQ